jgi:hypothetical protein
MAKKLNNSFLIIIIIAAAAAGALGYKYLTTPRERTTEEKVNAALEEMQKGLEKAADEFKDKRPLDDINNAGKQMMEDINKANGQPQNQ